MLTVAFVDLSTGGPTSWLWDFDDGQSSIQQNPVHDYQAGIYGVSLTATNEAGSDEMSKFGYIIVVPLILRGHEFHRLNMTTDQDGNGTEYTGVLTGCISHIVYTKVDFDDGVDFLATVESTGEVVWQESDVNASKTVAPRLATHLTSGGAALYAAGAAVNDMITIAADRIKLVVSNGGNVKTGMFDIVMG